MNNRGFYYLMSLSLSTIDRCDYEQTEKRNILYSVYAFACLYEEDFAVNPDKILYKHNICFKTEVENTDNLPKDCILVEENEKKFLRYDIDGESYKLFSGNANPDVPKKLGLYEMAYKIVTCSETSDELRAMWFIYLPFITLTGAPLDREYYNLLKVELLKEEIYALALKSKHSDMIYDSLKEMVLGGVDPVITDWYVEYVDWKNVKNEKGISREVEKYQKYLARGDFEYVLKGTEKLLNTFPYDQEIILMNIASRVSLGKQNKKLLEEALIIIEETLKRAPTKKEYFLYYKGLCKLGLGEIFEAKALFEVLSKEYKFELATFMLKALEKYNGEKI